MGELSKLERSAGFQVSIALAYLILNTSLNMLNKWALGVYKFRFPMLLTASHMIFGSLVLLPVMLTMEGYKGNHLHNWRREWKVRAAAAPMNFRHAHCRLA